MKTVAMVCAFGWAILSGKGTEGVAAANLELTERQETVSAFSLDPKAAAYQVWGNTSGKRCFAFPDDLLPACFERSLVLDEFTGDQPLRWIFTGPRAGVTVLIRSNEVHLEQRFYDSPGLPLAGGRTTRRHPEWSAELKSISVMGAVQSVTLRLDGKLSLVLLVNGKEVFHQKWIHDLSRHQLYLEGTAGHAVGRWLRPSPVESIVHVNSRERHQTMLGFGGITASPAYAMLSEEGKRRWWKWITEYNLLIQREYPNSTQLHREMDNWDTLADATPHYYGDNFPNGEISDFDYNKHIQDLGGQVWFEFWNLPPWVGTNVQLYAQAVVNYCQTAQRRTGKLPAIVGVQNELSQEPPQWQAMTLALRHALDAAGFKSVRIHMADASNLPSGIKFANGFRRSPEAWADIDFTATHMYDFLHYFTDPDGIDEIMTQWHNLGDGKPFLSTELCINGGVENQTDSYRLALAMGQLYQKNLTIADAVAMCYCWQLINVVQPTYGETRSLFVPDERNGFLPTPGSDQLRTFGAYSRRIRQGMTRVTANSDNRDLLVVAFSGGGRDTLVALNRSVRPVQMKLDWPGTYLNTLELVDPYHQNAVSPFPSKQRTVTISPGAIMTLSNVKLKSK